MQYFFLIFFVVIFFFSSAVTGACEASFSNGEADRPALLRRADRKLERDLQKVRNSPEEPGLKSKGFKSAYYAGVDLAREFNEVAKYLREIKADPKRTHIPYFADQIKKTIADFERSFKWHNQDKLKLLRERLKILEALKAEARKRIEDQNVTYDWGATFNNQDKLKFLIERLTLLETLKAEARKRIEDQNVTYDWWTTFNLRLVMIIIKPRLIKKLNEQIQRAHEHRMEEEMIDRFKDDPAVRVTAGIEIAYNKELAERIETVMTSALKEEKSSGISRGLNFLRAEFERLNPEEVLFGEAYTSKKLERILYYGLKQGDIDNGQFSYFQTVALQMAAKNEGLYDKILEKKDWYDLDALKTHEGTQELLSLDAYDFIVGVGVYGFIRLKEKFPQEIMFFTTDELGIMAFNKLEANSYFVGVSGSSVTVDGFKAQPLAFFTHDVSHGREKAGRERDISSNIIERINNISDKSDREKAEVALFIYRHERGSLNFREQLEEYYAGEKVRFFNTDWRDHTVASSRKMMRESLTRFLDPNSLQGVLPDSVNVNNREEVIRYLDESADIFSDILLTR